jgi:hypothetical protein
MALGPPPDHSLPGFNFNVEEWFKGDRYETLAIYRSLALARAAFAIAKKPAGPSAEQRRKPAPRALRLRHKPCGCG